MGKCKFKSHVNEDEPRRFRQPSNENVDENRRTDKQINRKTEKSANRKIEKQKKMEERNLLK